MKQITEYLNGNYYMVIYDDGTKVRVKVNPDDTSLQPEFPDSLELKITEVTPNGVVLSDILYNQYTSKIKPYTDVNIVACNPLLHPALIKFTESLQLNNVAVDLTISQPDIIADLTERKVVLELISRDLIRSLNIILTDSTDEKLYNIFDVLAKPVIQVTAGLVTSEDLDNLANKRIALKIVGYQPTEVYFTDTPTQTTVKYNLDMLQARLCKRCKKPTEFSVIGLDLAAAKQLHIVDENEVMVDTTDFIFDHDRQVMYIDLVNKLYSLSVNSNIKLKLPAPPTSITDIFKTLKNEYNI